MYLPLAEATVITFLAPAFTGYICHLLIKDPFTKKEQIASLLALAGVVLIARPTSFFGGSGTQPSGGTGPPEAPSNGTSTELPVGDEPTPEQRLMGIGIAMIGVLGASGAYTCIRCQYPIHDARLPWNASRGAVECTQGGSSHETPKKLLLRLGTVFADTRPS